MTFGERLKLIQQESGLTLPDFGRKIGVSKESLINYQKDRTKPDSEILSTVCKIFKVNPAWLLLGEGEPFLLAGGEAIGRAATSPAGEEMLREIIMAVEEWLNRRGLTLAPAKKADLVIELYRTVLEEDKKVDKDMVGEVFLKLVA